MPALDHITSCVLVTEEDIEGAIGCKADARALVEKMASVSRPNQGAARILAVLARMDNLDWLDGRLRVEIGGDGDVCVLDVLTQLGGGFSERVWPAVAVGVSLGEIRRAIKMHPRFILPLKLKHDRPSRIVLTAVTDLRSSSLPPPRIRVGEAALVWGERPAAHDRIPIAKVPRIDLHTPVDGFESAPVNAPRAPAAPPARTPTPSPPRPGRQLVPRPRRASTTTKPPAPHAETTARPHGSKHK